MIILFYVASSLETYSALLLLSQREIVFVAFDTFVSLTFLLCCVARDYLVNFVIANKILSFQHVNVRSFSSSPWQS